jgi:hypothetical protein
MTCVMNPSAGPIAFDPSIDGRAGDPQFHAFGDNRFMEGFALPFVSLAEMNTQHARLKLVFHD